MDETKVKLDAIRKLLEMPESSKKNTESCWKEWYLRPDKENYHFLVRAPIFLSGEEVGKIIAVMCWVKGKLCLSWDHTPWDEEISGRIGGGGTWKWMEIPE